MAENQNEDTEKTEEPTAKRLEDAHKKGDVPKSQEVNTWFVILGATLLVVFLSESMASDLATVFRAFLEGVHDMPMDGGNLRLMFSKVGALVLGALALPFFVLIVFAIAGNVVQHKPLLTTEQVKPKLSKISPIAGWKRLFSATSLVIAQGIGRIPEHGYASFEEAAEAAEEALADELGEDREITAEDVARANEQGVQQSTAGEDAEVEVDDEDSLFLYFLQEIEARRAEPRDDLVTRLVEAEVDGEQLTDIELVAFLVLLLVAGNETTTNLINHTIRGLAENPDQQRHLREHPELLAATMEEALRWESPIQSFYRRANVDTTVAGTEVKAGQALLVIYGAANHDPARYECPADFDIERFNVDSGSRDHLAFGRGIHTCLGANLARIEAAAAVGAVLERFAWIAPVEDQDVEWWDTPFFRGPLAYRVRLEEAIPEA